MTTPGPDRWVGEEFERAWRIIGDAKKRSPYATEFESVVAAIVDGGHAAVGLAAAARSGDLGPVHEALARVDEQIHQGLRQLVGMLKEDPEIRDVFDPPDLLLWMAAMIARSHPEIADRLPSHPRGFRRYPSLPAGALMALRDQRDVDAMAGLLEPGQVWVQVSALPNTEREKAWALAKYQQRLRVESTRAVEGPIARGPAALSPQERRAAARYTDRMTNPEVYRLLVEERVWPDDGSYSDPALLDRNAKRVKDFRRRAAGL